MQLQPHIVMWFSLSSFLFPSLIRTMSLCCLFGLSNVVCLHHSKLAIQPQPISLELTDWLNKATRTEHRKITPAPPVTTTTTTQIISITFKFYARNAARRLRSVCRNFMSDNENAVKFLHFPFTPSHTHTLTQSTLDGDSDVFVVATYIYAVTDAATLHIECEFQWLVSLIDAFSIP